jgi:membrane protein YdbS with pleckstrin-like domain
MEQFHINHLAVIVCAIANLALGALWYSPVLFYNAWKKENNLTDEQLKKINPANVYGISFILSVIISYNMAFFLGDSKTDMAWGTTAGFLTGFGFAALIFAIVALFEMRSWKYIFINGGYITVYFTIIGFILGAWR